MKNRSIQYSTDIIGNYNQALTIRPVRLGNVLYFFYAWSTMPLMNKTEEVDFMSILEKIRDFNDTKVCLVILVDDIVGLGILTEVIVAIGRDRCIYELYKDDITAYMVEIRMPYNRYLAMMKGLQKRGWNLKMESKVDIFNRLYKESWVQHGLFFLRYINIGSNERSD